MDKLEPCPIAEVYADIWWRLSLSYARNNRNTRTPAKHEAE